MSCTARSITTPTFDMRGGNGPTRVMRDGQDVLVLDRLLDRLHGRIEALDMADHERDVGAARGGDDLAALLDIGGDRLFHQHMDAARDAFQRDFVMQMGRRGDGHGVGLEIEQRVDNARPPGQPSTRFTRSRCCGLGSATPASMHVRAGLQTRGHGSRP